MRREIDRDPGFEAFGFLILKQDPRHSLGHVIDLDLDQGRIGIRIGRDRGDRIRDFEAHSSISFPAVSMAWTRKVTDPSSGQPPSRSSEKAQPPEIASRVDSVA